MATQRDFYGTLQIAGEDFGPFDAFAGGAYDTEETKYTPYDLVQRTYLGVDTVTNLTVSREYLPERDGPLVRRKDSLKRHPFVFTVQDKDADGNFQQNRPPYRGVVKQITPPDGNSNESGVAMLSIELSVGTPR
jgi:hypothetical protein